MGYTQQDIDGAFAQLTAQGYTPSEANAYINGVLAADGQGVQEDPRLTEMYADWSAQRQMETEARELQAYDDTVRAICAADPQIVADDFHAWVSVAGGDFDRARDLYYADVARRAARAEAEYNNDGKPLHWERSR